MLSCGARKQSAWPDHLTWALLACGLEHLQRRLPGTTVKNSAPAGTWLISRSLSDRHLAILQGRWPLFDELSALDSEVYHSLVQLKRYEGNAEDLALDFTGAA